MARRPTITDLARAAGVSTATVDRVVNARGLVRAETAVRVREAAERIGYHGAALIGARIDEARPRLRVGFVLQKGRQAFYQAFEAAARDAARAATGVRGEAVFEYSPSQAPADFAARLRSLAGRVDAVAATAVAHDAVTEAVTEIQAQGVPCFALLNDFAQGVRQSYIGLNNLKVGRVAAQMIAMTTPTPGKVGVFVGGARWHGHALRETGFRSYFREYADDFHVLEAMVNLETRQITYEATLALLDQHPDLAGLYLAGGGMEGAIAAVRETRAPGAVRLVVNELTPESREALRDRYVTMAIGTPLARVCGDLFELAGRLRLAGADPLPGQHFLAPDITLAEML